MSKTKKMKFHAGQTIVCHPTHFKKGMKGARKARVVNVHVATLSLTVEYAHNGAVLRIPFNGVVRAYE